MKKMKKILAFSIAVIMALSMMTFVSFATSEENSLPLGTYVMSPAWSNMEELETITCVLGGREYVLEYGVTAVSSIEEALALPRPVGMKPTIILAPGRYGNMTISSNIILAGPYFGLAPFNNPRKADIYNPEIEDMAIINDRSLDASKEAILTGKITIADGCTELEIDGIAMSTGAQITDTGRSMNDAVGAFTFHAKNIYGKDTTGSLFVFNGGTAISRYLYFTDCYFANAAAGISPTAEIIELDGFCFDGGKPTIYRKLYDPSNVVTKSTESFFNVYNSCFRNLEANGMLNQAVGVNYAPNVDLRDTVHMNVINSYFEDIGDLSLSPSSWNIRPQIASSNHSYVLKNNVFKAVSKPDITPIYFYKQSGAPIAECVIEDNIFINTKYPTRGNGIAPVDISRNYFCTAEGVRTNPTQESGVTYNGYYYDDSLTVGTFDFAITNSSVGSVECKTIVKGAATWTATVFCEEGILEPTFTFAKDDVQATLYSNSACTQEITEIDTSLFTSGEMTAYLKVERLGYSEKFTVKFTTADSSLRDVISIENATLDAANTSAIITVSEDVDEFILPTVGNGVVLSDGAEIEYYADPLLLEKITSVDLSNIEELPTLYAKVIAPNTEYDVWTIDFFVQVDEPTNEGVSNACDLLDFEVPGAVNVTVEDGFIYVELKDNATEFKPIVTVSDGATYGFYADNAGTITSKDNTKFKINSCYSSSFLFVTAEDGVSQNIYYVEVMSKRSPTRYADMNSVSSYAKEAVNVLNNSGLGLFVGDENGKFNPKNNITRYEVAVLMTKLCGINVELLDSVDVSYIFADYSKIPAWALPYVKASYVSGLISGTTQLDGSVIFDGSSNTTREQFITILMRAIASMTFGMSIDEFYSANELQVDTAFVKANVYDENDFASYAAKAIKVAIALELVNGSPWKDGVKVNPKQFITRQDVAVILANMVII